MTLGQAFVRVYGLMPGSIKRPITSLRGRLSRYDVKTVDEGGAKGILMYAFRAGQYLGGTNELPVQEVVADSLRPGAVFYDIGANVGFFTLLAARMVGPAGRVYAFEPVPANASAISRNAELNGFANVAVRQVAVSRASGRAELVLASHPGGASLRSSEVGPCDAVGSMEVETVSIDDLVAQGHLEPPSVIKLDVEGAEVDALAGMHRTVEQYGPVIIYEVDDTDDASFERRRKHLDDLVGGWGYTITHLRDAYPGQTSRVGHSLAIPGRFRTQAT
jgi:FkbM family methyltransferase